ncbi:tRNA-splicing endonuclease subunit Sen2-1-like [Argentina anserina]|uniref:tRNA-splicing endonuclease subunit Sen2-1-like n=1 Tax=Argentina anserina TaxID=57926 RepID=UPI0021766627|nr:tRNA-splicing endonuclease subunit Sen2-1-like [Potentilla anserina]XP_050384089.1 tRNA-splicing endonuclease subunit Sen2-1-like [Potentilla anserina]
MGPRWKGKGFEAKALADPMSKIVLKLQLSLTQSNCEGLLCGRSVLLSVEAEQADLLNRSCFGQAMVTAEKDKQWFELSLEEAFYLSYALKCLRIVEDKCLKSDEQLWQCMKSRSALFPYFYKAYSHLRMKNWVVMSGITYGADFVAYRHHPELVHSEYAVIVCSEEEEEGGANDRLRVWSDVHCATRLCGGVAKTLLVLEISRNGHSADSPSCLASCTVKERTITRWNPEQCREDQTVVVSENGAKEEN